MILEQIESGACEMQAHEVTRPGPGPFLRDAGLESDNGAWRTCQTLRDAGRQR